MADDPGKKLMEQVRDQSEQLEWNGHMRSGDEIILMFTKTDETELTYIEADEDEIDYLIKQLKLVKK